MNEADVKRIFKHEFRKRQLISLAITVVSLGACYGLTYLAGKQVEKETTTEWNGFFPRVNLGEHKLKDTFR